MDASMFVHAVPWLLLPLFPCAATFPQQYSQGAALQQTLALPDMLRW